MPHDLGWSPLRQYSDRNPFETLFEFELVEGAGLFLCMRVLAMNFEARPVTTYVALVLWPCSKRCW